MASFSIRGHYLTKGVSSQQRVRSGASEPSPTFKRLLSTAREILIKIVLKVMKWQLLYSQEQEPHARKIMVAISFLKWDAEDRTRK